MVSVFTFVFVSINNGKNKFQKYHSSVHPSKYMCWCTHGWWTCTLLPKTKDQLSRPTTPNKEMPWTVVWESSQFYRQCFCKNSWARIQSTRVKHGSAHVHVKKGMWKKWHVKCHTILGQGPPHDLREFWRSVEAACHSWQGMCLTTALQWHLIRTMAVQGGQGPGWHACRQLWLQPWGRGLSHADSHGWQFSPAWTEKDEQVSSLVFYMQSTSMVISGGWGERWRHHTTWDTIPRHTDLLFSSLPHFSFIHPSCLSVSLSYWPLSLSHWLLFFSNPPPPPQQTHTLFYTDLLFSFSLSYWPLVPLPPSLSY